MPHPPELDRAVGLLSSGLQEEELGRPCTREEWKTR